MERDRVQIGKSVLKTVYVDEKPEGLYKCNVTALEEYSNMNPGNKEHYAIEKNQFYELEKNNKLFNLNEENGFYALEVWKYNPKLLADGISKKDNVDPLSLYLSLKDKFRKRYTKIMERDRVQIGKSST